MAAALTMKTAETPRVPPVVEMTGGFPVLLPCPSDYLADRDLNDLREIERQASLGRRSHAQRLALALETRLGITMDDRLAALRASSETDAALEHAIALAPATAAEAKPVTRKDRKAAGFAPIAIPEVQPARAAELPAHERGRSKDEIKRWDRQRAALLNPNLALSEDQKEAKVNGMAQIEAAPKLRADAEWLQQSTAETLALAAGRGEETETDKAGRVNITTRDSLLSLIKSGKLTDAQAQAGRTCREAYELRSQSLGAMNYSDTGRGGRDHEASIAWGIAKANASMMLPFVERFIQLRHISNPVALTMFRNILCERHTIADHGTSQSVRERNTAAFILALDAAVDGIEAWARTRAGR